MAKTYTLTGTAYGGGQGSWSSAYWTGYYTISGRDVGKNGGYRAVSYVFNSSTLASLRSKTVTKLELIITVASGKVYANTNEMYPIGYKLNSGTSSGSSSDYWARSNADSTAAATTVVTYIRDNSKTSGTTTCSNTSFTFDITGTKVPVYGYVAGPFGSNASTYITLASTCTLKVTTNETDYTLNLSYNANGGSNAPSAQSQTVTTAGTPSYTFTISSTSPTRTGYNFLGWSTSSTATSASYQPGGSITISSNTTLYAVWQQITYTVTYNKGTSGSGTNTTDTKVYGTALTIKNAIFTRTGYTQSGWATSDGGSLVYGLGASYTDNAAVTLYPVWTINTYTVSYNKGANGAGSNTSAVKTYGTELTLLGATFTRTGYTQTGWSTTDGGSKDYDLGGSYTNNSAITLYPFWTINTYTVSYNKGSNGTGTNTTATKTYGTALTLLGATFTRTGYYQSGWATSDGGLQAYALSGSYTNNSAVTLYPVWTAYTVTIQYRANGASMASSHGDGYAIDSDGYITNNGSRNIQTISYGNSNAPVNYNNPNYVNLTYTGHHITSGIEWNTEADGTGTSFNQATSYSATDYASDVTTGNRTVVLYANWEIDTYTISYNANGGSNPPSSQTKTYGVNLTLSSSVPTYGTKNFGGWAESSDATVADYQPGDTFTKNANTVLYAVWGYSNSSVRVMGSDGSLHQHPLYYMSNNGLVSASLYYMGSDGVLHPQQ